MTDVTCDNCEYEWEYGGTMKRATCPSCGHKTSVDDDSPTV